MKYDIFISHASEDKPIFVKELAEALMRAGLSVWYDELSLKPGDSIRRSIEKGIVNSNAGVVVLSPRFFEKEWPQRELDALLTLEIGNKNKLYPVWLDIDAEDVAAYSPLLADKFAILASDGIDGVAEKISGLVSRGTLLSDAQVQEIIERFFDDSPGNQRFLKNRCIANLTKLTSYQAAYEAVIEEINAGYSDDAYEKHFHEIEKQIEQRARALTADYEIPLGAWLESRAVDDETVEEFEERISTWCDGLLGELGSYQLYFDLDEWLDIDYLLVLFSVPNQSVAAGQRFKFIEAIVDIGSRNILRQNRMLDALYEEVMQLEYGDT